MVKLEVVMPQLGESVVEGTIVQWLKKEGEPVARDEPLVEISTDKVDTEIPSPASGFLTQIVAKEGETVKIGTVLAYIETEELAKVAPPPRERREEAPRVIPFEERLVRPREAPARFYSPLVRSMAKTEGIRLQELEAIPGTGRQGRLTKDDLGRYLEQKRARIAPPPPEMERPAVAYPPERVEIVPMDVMRKAIAEHMVRSVHTSAHVTTVSEADMSKVVAAREKNKEEFLKREGSGLTYTPFFVLCAIRALKEFPIVNSSVEGDKIIIKRFINMGIAVALERGLIVPVIKEADEKSFQGLARAIHDLSERARNKKLLPDDVHGGTFTLTNPGMFGNLLGTPIINQPQVAILAVGAIKKRVVVIDDAIAIRPLAFLSLTYDHRVIDGAVGGMFLQRVVHYLENFDPAWMGM